MILSRPRARHPMSRAGAWRGRVEVSFGSGVVEGRVLGAIDEVVIDLVPAEPEPSADAEAFAERAGWSVESPDESDGVVITAIAPGSPAERAGLVAGDRIVEVEGLRVLSEIDAVKLRDGEEEERAYRAGLDTVNAEIDAARREAAGALLAAAE